MKRRSTLALLSAVAVVAVGIFISFFLSFSTNDSSNLITLPGQGSAVIDTSPDIAESNRDKLHTVSINADNIQAVISSLQRPEEYQCQTETVYFYGVSQATFTSELWKRGDLVRIHQGASTDGAESYALLTPEWVYTWANGPEYGKFPRQENDMDLYSRAPSYEDLLAMPREQILVGELREQDDTLYLYAESMDALTGEREVWYILVENGLLVYAEGHLKDALTYRCSMMGLQLELDAETDFVLPDGTIPQ